MVQRRPRLRGSTSSPSSPRFDLPRQAFEDVIDGVAMDLDTTRYEHVRRSLRILPARRLGGWSHLHQDFRVPERPRPRVRRQPRRRPAAHEYPARHSRRSRQGPRVSAARGPVRPRLYRGRSGRRGGDRTRSGACWRSSAAAHAIFTSARFSRDQTKIAGGWWQPKSCAPCTSKRSCASNGADTTCSRAASESAGRCRRSSRSGKSFRRLVIWSSSHG